MHSALRVVVLALLSAGCHRHAPAIAPDAQSMLPPIPATVPSALGPVAVVWIDSLADGHGQPMLGGFHPVRRLILLNRQIVNPVVQWHTLMHERCHVWMWDSGLRAVIASEIAQQLCDAYATNSVADLLLARGRRR